MSLAQAPAAAAAPVLPAVPIAAVAAVGALIQYSSTPAIHNQVNALITNGVNRANLRATNTADALWRVSVVMNILRGYLPSLNRPGHAGLVVWRATAAAPPYRTFGIDSQGNIGDEPIRRADLRHSGTLDFWYLTVSCTVGQAHAALDRVAHLAGQNIRYNEFTGNRYANSFNCVSFVDDVLGASGLSSAWARPASWLTPWFYSLSFVTWNSSYIGNASNL